MSIYTNDFVIKAVVNGDPHVKTPDVENPDVNLHNFKKAVLRGLYETEILGEIYKYYKTYGYECRDEQRKNIESK